LQAGSVAVIAASGADKNDILSQWSGLWASQGIKARFGEMRIANLAQHGTFRGAAADSADAEFSYADSEFADAEFADADFAEDQFADAAFADVAFAGADKESTASLRLLHTNSCMLRSPFSQRHFRRVLVTL